MKQVNVRWKCAKSVRAKSVRAKSFNKLHLVLKKFYEKSVEKVCKITSYNI